MKRNIGIHIRLQHDLQEGLEKAKRCGVSVYQSFLMDEGGNYFSLSDEAIKTYIESSEKEQVDLIIHTAYWSSVTKFKGKGFAALQQEAEVANKLQKKFLIVHPGSIKGLGDDPNERAKKIAEAVNAFIEEFPNIILLLENSPHGGLSFGGSLDDFAFLLKYIDKKDRVGFCIDTAHAHAYGYDIVNKCTDFIDEIDRTIGCERVYVLHLNDTLQKCGSKIDKHAIVGEGLIGNECLKRFVQSEKLQHAHVILELPKMEEAEEKKIVNMVKGWDGE